MKHLSLVAGFALGAALLAPVAASAQYAGPRASQVNYSNDDARSPRRTYSSNDILDKGHRFFGSTTRGLAGVVEKAVDTWGEPDGYILGEEGSGAFVGGLRYGEGKLFTRGSSQADRHIFWQGPSLGFDWGGDGNRTMILVYNLRSSEDIYHRFAGINGSAYLVGGFSMTALKGYDTVLVPIRTGLGARLGVNVGYLKFTERSTWNPF
ncbi:DUF1134 domain-containing protein [Methylopila sp. M107]|uniref:DUF1134 domain-containing protein n=1 Tax=Methylopila sp. M107 TaxID=1101190 RepID=UPI00037EB49F|nr:DUF1134 domain-containing protein [Methylopila sp. M107]